MGIQITANKDPLTIEKNNLNVTGTGVLINGASNVHVLSNTIRYRYARAQTGITILYDSANNIIEDNNILYNAEDQTSFIYRGIFVTGDGTRQPADNTIIKNSIELNSPVSALGIFYAKNTAVQDNTIQRNTEKNSPPLITIEGSTEITFSGTNSITTNKGEAFTIHGNRLSEYNVNIDSGEVLVNNKPLKYYYAPDKIVTIPENNDILQPTTDTTQETTERTELNELYIVGAQTANINDVNVEKEGIHIIGVENVAFTNVDSKGRIKVEPISNNDITKRTEQITIENANIQSFERNGLSLEGVKNVVIKNSVINVSGGAGSEGIGIGSTSIGFDEDGNEEYLDNEKTEITDTQIYTGINEGPGISIATTTASDITINNVHIAPNMEGSKMGTGIAVTTPNGNVKVKNTTILNTPQGIVTYQEYDTLPIQNLNVQDTRIGVVSGGTGIQSSGVKNTVLENNNIQFIREQYNLIGGYGIYIDSSDKSTYGETVQIFNNSIDMLSQKDDASLYSPAIGLYTYSPFDAQIIGNNIEAQTGVYVEAYYSFNPTTKQLSQDNVKSLIIKNNVLHSAMSSSTGIISTAEVSTINNNNITMNGEGSKGMFITDSSSENFPGTNNIIENNIDINGDAP